MRLQHGGFGRMGRCCWPAWAWRRWRPGGRGGSTRGTVLIGDGALDGALFLPLALALVFGARLLLPHFGPRPRCSAGGAGVGVAGLDPAGWCRLPPRPDPAPSLPSAWPRIAWGHGVGWITGLLPVLLDELDDGLGSAASAHAAQFVEGGFSAVLVMLVALWIRPALRRG